MTTVNEPTSNERPASHQATACSTWDQVSITMPGRGIVSRAGRWIDNANGFSGLPTSALPAAPAPQSRSI